MPTTQSNIYYASKGNGRTLLFVHGSGADHTIWGHQLQGLSKDFRVVTIDLNGHAKSPYREGDGLETYSSDILDVIADIGERVMLLGHSLGGALTLNVAIFHPEVLLGIGLIGTGAKLRVHPDLLSAIENDFERATDMILDWEFSTKPPDNVLKLARDQILSNGQRTLSRDFNTCNQFDVIDQLENIELPTLVLCGKEDKLTPVKYSEFLRDNIGTTQLEIINGAGHNVMLEQPDVLNDAIRKFAEGLD